MKKQMNKQQIRQRLEEVFEKQLKNGDVNIEELEALFTGLIIVYEHIKENQEPEPLLNAQQRQKWSGVIFEALQRDLGGLFYTVNSDDKLEELPMYIVEQNLKYATPIVKYLCREAVVDRLDSISANVSDRTILKANGFTRDTLGVQIYENCVARDVAPTFTKVCTVFGLFEG